MFKVFAYLSKRSDITTEAFIDYHENHHVPLVLSLAPLPTVYKRNYLAGATPRTASRRRSTLTASPSRSGMTAQVF